MKLVLVVSYEAQIKLCLKQALFPRCSFFVAPVWFGFSRIPLLTSLSWFSVCGGALNNSGLWGLHDAVNQSLEKKGWNCSSTLIFLEVKGLKADAEGVWACDRNTELHGPAFLRVWKNWYFTASKTLHELAHGQSPYRWAKKMQPTRNCYTLGPSAHLLGHMGAFPGWRGAEAVRPPLGGCEGHGNSRTGVGPYVFICSEIQSFA